MEPNDKRRLDFQTFVTHKISEKEAELRHRKYMQFMIQAKVSDFTQIQALNFLYKVGKSSKTCHFINFCGPLCENYGNLKFLPRSRQKRWERGLSGGVFPANGKEKDRTMHALLHLLHGWAGGRVKIIKEGKGSFK